MATFVFELTLETVLTTLQRVEGKIDELLGKVNVMSQATDNLANAVQQNTTLDQALLAGVHDLTVQNQTLTEQIRQAAATDAQIQQWTDQLSANNDQLATAVASLATTPAPTDGGQGGPQTARR